MEGSGYDARRVFSSWYRECVAARYILELKFEEHDPFLSVAVPT